ncbi:MAG: hypothetical protein HZA50_07225 [Planctomycetes bacterium]|nr:hypothetical protein [Planctomycetota bacterium]
MRTQHLICQWLDRVQIAHERVSQHRLNHQVPSAPNSRFDRGGPLPSQNHPESPLPPRGSVRAYQTQLMPSQMKKMLERKLFIEHIHDSISQIHLSKDPILHSKHKIVDKWETASTKMHGRD